MRYTASRKAFVFRVRPSPTPPKSVMEIMSVRFLNGTRLEHVGVEKMEGREEEKKRRKVRVRKGERSMVVWGW